MSSNNSLIRPKLDKQIEKDLKERRRIKKALPNATCNHCASETAISHMPGVGFIGANCLNKKVKSLVSLSPRTVRI